MGTTQRDPAWAVVRPPANSTRPDSTSDLPSVRSPWFILSLVVLTACFSGCTSWTEYVRNGFKVGPNYCPPGAETADNWIDATDPNVKTDPAEDGAWWQTFRDPVLDSLIQSAYQQNLSLRAAGLRILEARAQRGIAAGNLLPQSQDLFGSYTRNALSANTSSAPPIRFFDDWQLGGALAWELDFWGRFRRAIEAADANLDASIESYDDILVLLLAEVAQNYADLRTAEQRLEYARKNAGIQRDSLRLAEVKFSNGATTKLDVTQGQSSLAQTEATIPPLEAARRQAVNQICILLGMPPQSLDERLGGRLPIPTAPPQVAVGIPADLLRRRPDIRRAEREVAAQSAQIGIATSGLYPHISITGTLYFEAANFSNLFDGDSLAGNVGPSFRWDVLNYGRLKNNIRFQEARFQELAVTYQNLVLQANAEAENSLVGFLKAQQQVKYLAESVSAAEQSVGLVRDQYDAGKTDFNRVLTVEQTLTQQQDQLALAQGSVAKSLISLYKALGGGWQIRLSGAEGQTNAAESQPTAEPRPAEDVPPPPVAPAAPKPPQVPPPDVKP